MPIPNRSIDRVTLLNITFFVEAFILFAATLWSHVSDIQLLTKLQPTSEYFLYGAGCGVAIAGSSIFILWLGKSFGVFSNLRTIAVQQIAPLFHDLTLFDLLAVACVSGFCEEILFRGIMQQQFGLLYTSLIFGLFHCPNLRFISYGIWVTAAGLLLGYLYQASGNLWVPIAAHVVSNGISLIFLRYAISRTSEPSAEDPK